MSVREEKTQKQYWMQPAELQGEVAVQDKGEFVTDPRATGPQEGEFTRRDFLKFVGISSVLAGAAACARRPVEKIVPYLNKPEDTTLGKSLWYSSTAEIGGVPSSVIVKTREGRPIKLEGNPSDPVNGGGLSARGQGSIWNLYDPDRVKQPHVKQNGGLQPATMAELDSYVRSALAKSHGKVALLTGPQTSPSERILTHEFMQGVQGRHVTVDLSEASDIAQAQLESYGRAQVPSYRLADAEVIVSLGADFLGTWGNPVAQARDWQKHRQLYGKHDHHLSKLICVEPQLSLTGTNADERYMVSPANLLRFALTLAHEVAAQSRGVSPQAKKALAAFGAKQQAEILGVSADNVRRIAQQLWKQRGRSAVLGGTLTGRLGVALQNVVNFINSALGNDGKSVDWANFRHGVSAHSTTQLLQLVGEIEQGDINTIIITGVNPVFTLPDALGLQAALAKVQNVIYLGDRLDETAQLAHAVVPESHFLERWGDAESEHGVYSVMQPSIQPLYESRSLGESLLAWSGRSSTDSASKDWHVYVQHIWRSEVRPEVQDRQASFSAFWEHALREGVVRAKPVRASKRSFRDAALRSAVSVHDKFAKSLPSDRYQLVVTPSYALGEGEEANNSWMQELPDPVAKITWDNYASVAPATARDNSWEEGDIIEVATAHGSARLPVHVQPGTHPDAIVVARGYGRTHAGQVGNGVGVNVQSFGAPQVDGVSWAALAVNVKHMAGKYELAVTQGHHRIEGRPILQEATLEEYKHDHHAGASAHGHGEMPSLWDAHEYPGNRWAMGIDLNSCTGCSACMIACQVENNVPPVGKKEVLTGREMHWIRIDRYYSGPEDNPDVTHQPMLCQHCEKAPCETVCPVLATVHDSEGLNVQVYNRCVGTRYCANNCPYKVRRFNWYDWGNKEHEDYAWDSPLHLMLNPDVTVREKGVMEKCTFCVQRIRRAKEDAKQDGRDLADGELKTACQQSCPTSAIRFGNVNDPKSKVSKFAHHARGFTVLAELNVKPQVTYLTKIRNKDS